MRRTFSMVLAAAVAATAVVATLAAQPLFEDKTWQLSPEGAGRYRLIVHAAGASSVELMGDVTDWQPVSLSRAVGTPVLGTGALLKNTFCLARGTQAFMGPHIGDLENLETFDFKGWDIGLFSPGASVSAIHAPRAAAAGCVVIDNTSHFRMEPDIPLVVPEVNGNRHRSWRPTGSSIGSSDAWAISCS